MCTKSTARTRKTPRAVSQASAGASEFQERAAVRWGSLSAARRAGILLDGGAWNFTAREQLKNRLPAKTLSDTWVSRGFKD